MFMTGCVEHCLSLTVQVSTRAVDDYDALQQHVIIELDNSAELV